MVPFSCPTSILLKIEEYQRKGGIDTAQGPVGLLGTKTFCVPHFFDYRKQPSFSLHDLPWVPIGRFKQLLIREGRGRETREKQSRAALGQGPVSPLTIHTTISLSCFADVETPSRWEKLRMVCCPEQWFLTKGNFSPKG